MTAVTERPDQAAPERAGRRSRTLIALVVVLALVAAGLGGWIVYDQTRSSGTGMSDEVAQVLDDYGRAWEEKDATAMRAIVTDDFLINEYIYKYEVGEGLELFEHIGDDVNGIVFNGFLLDWQTEQVGEALVVGEGPWMVSIEENWLVPKGFLTSHYDGVGTYVVVDDAGTLKIANHYWAGILYDTEN